MKPTGLRTRIVISCAMIVFAVLTGTSALDVILQKSPVRHLDNAASHYFDQSLGRALTTFAVVRGINGVISVILVLWLFLKLLSALCSRSVCGDFVGGFFRLIGAGADVGKRHETPTVRESD